MNSITAMELDARCLPLLQAVKQRGTVTQAELDEVLPADHESIDAWLSCYGQLRAWVAMPAKADTDSANNDALVTAALREAPIPVRESDGLYVYPKSFETMLQIKVLDTQLDRFTAELVGTIDDTATLDDIERAISLSAAVSYLVHLISWAWTSEGPGLPFKATDPQPVIPERILALSPADALEITRAVHQFSASLAAVQQMVDPTPAREGGSRPSWAGFFEAVGSQAHIDPRELAVTHTLGKVLAMAHLANDRQRVRSDSAVG